nr:16S rRNA (cytidine(1402)-2'-O)-methyltransferase [Kineosphaera limosa]
MDGESGPAPDLPGGVLVLAATPIGDARDASPRLAQELARADVVAAEDTRRLQRLSAALGIRAADVPGGRLLSYHDHNERARTPELARQVQEGRRVVLVTDAGMPSVSDPGYRLVEAVVADGGRVTCVPGPSAVLMALAVSGLPVDRFCFEGFPPRKSGERARALAALATEPRTLVFFEAPHRLTATLGDLSQAFGAERPAAVCRELTKRYEQVVRGPLRELHAWAQEHPEQVRGEITLVVAGATADGIDPDDAAAQVGALVAQGARLKDACRTVAARTGLSARELYAAQVAAKKAAT